MERDSDSVATRDSVLGLKPDTAIPASHFSIALASQGMESVGWTMWVLAFIAALSGSLFGYDTGYISSVLVSIGDDFGHTLSHMEEQYITSATSLGALVAALCAVFPSDLLGRKFVIAVANVIFIVGAIVQAASHTVAQMIIGRIIVGLGVGFASMIVPLWIGELAPAHLRGRLVTLNVVFLTLGQLVATAIGAAFQDVKGGWRYTVSGGAIPAIVSLVSMAWLPESPRFDSYKGRVDRVTRTFQRIFPHASESYCRMRAQEVADNIKAARASSANLTFATRVRRLLTGPNLRALAIACGLQALQQLSGFNTLMYYSAKIFQSVGFDQPIAVSLIIGGTNFIATCIALKYIDMVGRRRAMLYTVPLMTASLVFISISFYYLPQRMDSGGKMIPDIHRHNAWSYLLIVAIVLYVLFYGLGTGNVPWQQGELFANDTRALGTSLATATNWSCNLAIGATYLSLTDAITQSGAFGFYAGLCALGFIGIVFCFPDTRSLSLEEVQTIFQDSWGIRAADKLRAHKAAVARDVRARDEGVIESGIDAVATAHNIPPSYPAPTRTASCAAEQMRASSLSDPLDDWKPTRSNLASIPALPLALPSGINGPPMPSLRRSSTEPYNARESASIDVGIVRPPRIVRDATNPLSQLGIRGDSLMLFVTCFASIGVFLFGYDQGVMSGILTHPAFKSYFGNPTATEIGTMVAILEVGALITSLAAGVVADRYGRLKVILWGALIFSLGGAIQTCATGYTAMVIGRIISGFGVGFLSMIVPTYQSEVSPAENRGKLACIEFTGNIIGYMASVWFDYSCSFFTGNLAWRVPLLMQPVIGLVLAFGSVLLPESPRWLLDQDRDVEGMKVLADLHETNDPRLVAARLEFSEIKSNVLHMRAQGDRSYLTMWRRFGRRTLIGMSSQAFAQLNGINVISYYAPLVFESAGWRGRDALLMTGLNAIIYVLSTIPTWFLVDSWGRRPILLSGAILCAITLGLCGMFLRMDRSYTPQAVVVCVVAFNAAFGYSWGPIPWAWTPEIMPLAFRAKGASLSTATNWLFNWIVGQLTPILQERIKWRLYILHAVFCLCSFVLVYFFYPETQGVPLEEMDALFGDAASPVPQGDFDDDDDEENDAHSIHSHESDPVIPRRTSISRHPRFTAPFPPSREQRRQQPFFQSFYGAITGNRDTGRGEYSTVTDGIA
ncbi:hypothetical protein MCUN1_003207 [Malassezia cuniculi]|uniref:Major facilitator superfamily (MFS) profile domain-containing protein n=1 Tax=Malassezia cuniculi TaxID=948313 RepID=A0AAF0J7J9_9BASI|nr:hypothetical protein MCUN1_003207 [Malassezia cuniculi]